MEAGERNGNMASERVADMTMGELRVMIRQEIDERLRIRELLRPRDERTVAEINDSIRRHRWTPPPGARSNLELLREDRDQ
jgi:hypothetical protein